MMTRRVFGLVLVITLAGSAGAIAARVVDRPTPRTAPSTETSPSSPDGVTDSPLADSTLSGTDITVAPPSHSFDVGGSLASYRGGMLVAYVSGATEVRSEVLANGDAIRHYVRVTVDELLFVVDRDAAPEARAWRLEDLDLPPIEIGDHLTLRETYLTQSQEGFDFELPSGQLFVSLNYAQSIQEEDGDPVFGVSLAATVSPDGSLHFLHRRFGSSLDQQLTEFLSHLDWEKSPAELIAAWTAETWHNVDTDVRGPIQQAFVDSLPPRPTHLDRWNATDPRHRSLDAESTPPEVLEGLVETLALVDLVGDARPSDRFLYIRTDLGIVHAAHIPAGSHPTTFLAPPGATLEVYIAFDEPGDNETLVARIPSEEWMSVRDRARILIRLDDEQILTPTAITEADDPFGIVSIVDSEEAAAILMGWAAE